MRRADRIALALVVAGATVSGYLTWLHYSGGVGLCLGSSGCETVQTSRYAELGGVPVALLGFMFFVAAGALVVRRRRLPLFGLTLTAVMFTAYLTYLELFVIGAICPWCVAIAACTVGLFALAVRDVASV